MRGTILLAAALACAGDVVAAPYAFEGSLRGGPFGQAAVADGPTLVTVAETAVARIAPATRTVVATYPLPAISPFPRALAVGAGDVLVGGYVSDGDSGHGVVQVLDAASGAIRLTLASPSPDRNDFFGSSVAVLGDHVLVGAPGERRVYLFAATTGALLRTFDDPSAATPAGSWFGGAVAAAGGLVWVDAPRAGVVYRFDPDTGELAGTVVGGPWFGDGALVGAGAHVLVGATAGPGEVRRYDGATGALLGAYADPAPAPRSAFGRGAIGTDGTILAVGDTAFGAGDGGEEGDFAPTVGAVHVFDVATGMLLATLANPTPALDTGEDELFGRAVALVGTRVAVTDPSDQLPAGPGASLYLFDDVATCGDGAITGTEGCDDGNTASDDGCDEHCRPTACGNGVVAGDEACDDGNLAGGDGCDQNCRPTGCGNGAVTAGEECDDGGRVAGDGCSPRCRLERCGNGILDPGETCDDTNDRAGDGCDACRLEPRDAFTCYRVRRATRPSTRVVVHDGGGTRAVVVGRPVALCLGDGVTAPATELTCYRARTARPARRDDTLEDGVGTAAVQTGAWRTLCLPSDGAGIVRYRHTLVDPTPNTISEGGFGFAAAVAGARVVVSEPAGPSAFQGSQHRFAGNDARHLGTTVAPWASRLVGTDVTDAGNDEVVVASMDDDAYLMSVRTGAFLRRYVADGSRTPDDRRQIVASGRWVLHGDPSNHLAEAFAGAVQVFDRASGALVRTLLAPEPLAFSGFGIALATLGDEPLVGDGTGVRRYDPAAWTPTRTYSVVPGSSSGLAAAGDRVLVGTDVRDDRPGRGVLLDAASGAEVRTLTDPLGQPGDLFGIAATSATGAFVVGAARAGWLLPDAGAVHVFDAASGERLHTILPPDLAAGGWFGRKVAAGGDLIVGTRLGDGWIGRGEAYVFTRRPLDAYGCRAIRRGGSSPSGASVRLVTDRLASATAALDRLTAVCHPVARDGAARRDPALLLTCYRSTARAAVPRDVVVRNALGTQSLTLVGRRAICLPARNVGATD